ncbi:MAG TPA: PAS domain S-box protein, partial [Kofleriaceae bacterium]|nr:PAS domain S-box protein [Kofleriaceae bacterium]
MSEGAMELAVRRIELGGRVLAAAPISILLIDGHGAIQYVNPHFERLTGYRLDEVQGKDWFDMFVPERDRTATRALFHDRYGQGDGQQTHINPIVTRGGEEREIEWTGEVLSDSAGENSGLLVIGRDITERKAAQDALQASEQRLSEAQTIAKIGAWRTDLRTSEDWWSEEQYRITGYPIGTPVNRDMFLDVIHPDDRTAFEQGFARVLAEGTGTTQFRILRPDGVVRDIQGRAKLIYDARGVAVGMAGTIQDITEYNLAQESVRRASELLRTVVAGAPIAILALDRNGIVTLAEGRALDKLGVVPGEIVGTSALARYGSIPGFVDAFRRALTGEQTALDACVGTNELEVVCAPSVDGRGRTDGVIAVAFDVTGRKRAEAAQQQLVDELRTRDRRKNEFIAMLSHELRNPLSAIQNALYVLDRVAPADSKTTHATGIMMRQVTQLARLVEDLLDVSRITQNKISLQRAPVDLGQLVRAAVDDHKELFARHGVHLEMAVPRTPVIVNGDAARVTQVIGNLLSNAVKFTPRGGRTTISLSNDAAAGQAVLHVTDTGAGIDPELVERLFQPFSQADHTLA